MAVAVIVAAGRGERLGAELPKALVQVAGRPLVQWSIDALAAVEEIDQIVLALPPGAPAPPGVTAVDGGAVRSDSVRRGLAASAPGEADEVVVVHDAARPLVTVELIERVIGVLRRDQTLDAAIAAAPVTDTVKRADEAGVVRETLDRAVLWAVQTPQVFRRAALERALDVSEEILARATDDAWLIERAGGRVAVVAAEASNLKVTTPQDLALAEMLLRQRR
jgi:2-C-methyl-D-erythritol 4-phosphate cytidylyltransferase